MTETSMPSAFLITPVAQTPALEVRDQNGDVWVRKQPAPGLVSIPLGVGELFELYAWYDQRSAIAVRQGNPDFWAACEFQAARLLGLAVSFCPELGPFQRQRRQHPDGTSREGTV